MKEGAFEKERIGEWCGTSKRFAVSKMNDFDLPVQQHRISVLMDGRVKWWIVVFDRPLTAAENTRLAHGPLTRNELDAMLATSWMDNIHDQTN